MLQILIRLYNIISWAVLSYQPWHGFNHSKPHTDPKHHITVYFTRGARGSFWWKPLQGAPPALMRYSPKTKWEHKTQQFSIHGKPAWLLNNTPAQLSSCPLNKTNNATAAQKEPQVSQLHHSQTGWPWRAVLPSCLERLRASPGSLLVKSNLSVRNTAKSWSWACSNTWAITQKKMMCCFLQPGYFTSVVTLKLQQLTLMKWTIMS